MENELKVGDKYGCLEIIGDCVAWNPEIAPQATVININGQIGFPSGCKLLKVISGIGFVPLLKIVAPAIPTAIIIRHAPKIGYNFPIILSIGSNVAKK